jgi:drug/metabolite transporter (DMT)-like permease
VLVASVNTAIPFLLISWGEVTVPSGLASVLNSTVPIFSVLLAGAVLREESVTLVKIGGVILGFAGVVLLLSRDLSHSSILSTHLEGQGAIILASVCYAVGAVLVRYQLRGIPSLTTATYALSISAIEVFGLSLIFSRPDLGSLNGTTIFSILWLGILGSGFAYVLAYFILGEWGAARYTLVAYMMPIVGLTLGAITLGETLDWRILAGSALVVSGIILASIIRRPSVVSAPENVAVAQRP